MEQKQGVFNKDFIILNIILFFAYFNITVFFQFPYYLEHSLKISPEWAGIIVGIFSLTGLILRPFLSAIITPVNAKKYIFFSLILIFIALILYLFAKNIETLFLVRIFHGIIYVTLGTSLIAGIVGSIPSNQSGKAFSIVGIVILLPFAVMPPLLKPLTLKFSFISILISLGFLLIISVLILPLLSKKRKMSEKEKKETKITKKDIIENFKDIDILILFVVAIFLFSAFSSTFYYLQGYGVENNIQNPGWFFTISTIVQLAILTFMGNFLDRVNKIHLLGFSMFIMAVAFFLFGVGYNRIIFMLIAVFFGTAMGLAIPLINSLMFDYSIPKLRAFNSNLNIQMFQGGLFLGASIGGIIVAKFNYVILFISCGTLCSLVLFLIFLLHHRRKGVENASNF